MNKTANVATVKQDIVSITAFIPTDIRDRLLQNAVVTKIRKSSKQKFTHQATKKIPKSKAKYNVGREVVIIKIKPS